MVDVKSVGRALDILLAFARERPSMNVAELEDIIGIVREELSVSYDNPRNSAIWPRPADGPAPSVGRRDPRS